jgi:type IV pilus assembly protein PilY1
MGKGGNRYFALDVTNPADITNEATAASKVLWEFSDPNMGFTYGKPMIAKTAAFGGIWLVIVASGYNNPDGHGRLYFIRAKDGHLMKTMTTSGLDGGSPGTPSGLAHPAGYTQDFRNQLAEQIYAGDLLGDFWRFDISDSDESHWTVGKMARLVDPSDHAQPVTTPPQIEVDVRNGVDRWVFVGTGKLYDDSDIADHQVQTMYAFRDGTQTAPVTFPDPSFPLSRHTSPGMQLLPHTVATQFGLASKPANGWFDDLPDGVNGQRIVVPPQAALFIVAYVGTSPQTDPCLTGQNANVYARDFANGVSLFQDGGGVYVENVVSDGGAVGLEIVGFETAPGASQPDIRLAITHGTTGEVTFPPITLPPNLAGHRMSWRLLGQ